MKFVIVDFDLIPNELPDIQQSDFCCKDVQIFLAADVEQLAQTLIENGYIHMVCILADSENITANLKIILTDIRQRHEECLITCVISPNIDFNLSQELYELGVHAVMSLPSNLDSIRKKEYTYAHLKSCYTRLKYLKENFIPITQITEESQQSLKNDNQLRLRPELIIDPIQRVVYLHDVPHRIPALEFDILLLLANNADIPITHSQIKIEVWGSTKVSPTELTSYISRIRKKIEKNPQKPNIIITCPRYGYLFSTKTVELCKSK